MWRIEMWQLQQYSAPGWMYRWHRRGLQLWFGESGWGGESSLYHRFFQFPDLTIWNVIEFDDLTCFSIFPEETEMTDAAKPCRRPQHWGLAPWCWSVPWRPVGHVAGEICSQPLPTSLVSSVSSYIQRIQSVPDANAVNTDRMWRKLCQGMNSVTSLRKSGTSAHFGTLGWLHGMCSWHRSGDLFLSLSQVSLHFGSGHPRPKSCLKFFDFLNLLLHVYCCSYSELGSSLAFSCFGGRLELPYGCEDHLSSSWSCLMLKADLWFSCKAMIQDLPQRIATGSGEAGVLQVDQITPTKLSGGQRDHW